MAQPEQSPLIQESRLAADRLGWRLIGSVAVLCMAMMLTVWWYYRSATLENVDEANRGAMAVTVSRSVQIENWRQERMGDGRVLLASHAAKAAEQILRGRGSDQDLQEIASTAGAMAHAFLYADISLVSSDGKVKFRLDQTKEPEDDFRQSRRRASAQAALQAHDVTFSDLTNDTRDGSPRMSVVVPVANLGAFILEIDPRLFIYPYLGSWPGASSTGECLLLRLEGDDVVYLSPSRRQPGITPFFRLPLKLKLPPPAIMDSGWIKSGTDYRGHQVYAAIRRVNGSPWYLISKLDADEVDRPIKKLGVETGLLMIAIGFAGIVLVRLLATRHRSEVHREKEEWFRTAANESPVLLWMMSPEGVVTFLNTPLQVFLGVDANFAQNWQWKDSIHPEDYVRAQTALRQSIANHHGLLGEFRVRRFDGKYRTILAESLPRLDQQQRLIGFAGSITDITERREAVTLSEIATARLQREVEEHKRTAREVQFLTARLITAREDERKHLATELQDDLNQRIAAVSVAIGNLKQQMDANPEQARQQSEEIQREITGIFETVQRISHELHPAELQYHGLVPTLRETCEKFGLLTGVPVLLVASDGLDELDESAAITLFRIVQDALDNVSRHAGARSTQIEIERAGDEVRLVVFDDGVGMPPESERKQGLGLVSIRERVRLLRGTLEIDSAPGSGTALIVRIPLKA